MKKEARMREQLVCLYKQDMDILLQKFLHVKTAFADAIEHFLRHRHRNEQIVFNVAWIMLIITRLGPQMV